MYCVTATGKGLIHWENERTCGRSWKAIEQEQYSSEPGEKEEKNR